jgi:hypothetical protein
MRDKFHCAVVCADGPDSVLVHVDTLRVIHTDGWLRWEVEAETAATGRRRLGFGVARGVSLTGDRVRAQATLSSTDPAAARLADRWGAYLERVLGDGLRAALSNRREPLKRLRFTWEDGELRVLERRAVR